ncbi:hypothetical protein Fcan01_26996 [Folsomia candida]|uniref:Uncharacterized protein n=1 Tax=Folsomia candida TaxID=158441 RepID=A0A226CZG0_FOLCA|nr:hypothetical protein Fcan01_26996 [Folsomia candida]
MGVSMVVWKGAFFATFYAATTPTSTAGNEKSLQRKGNETVKYHRSAQPSRWGAGRWWRTEEEMVDVRVAVVGGVRLCGRACHEGQMGGYMGVRVGAVFAPSFTLATPTSGAATTTTTVPLTKINKYVNEFDARDVKYLHQKSHEADSGRLVAEIYYYNDLLTLNSKPPPLEGRAL